MRQLLQQFELQLDRGVGVRKAFTLIELGVVVLIIAILGAVAAGTAFDNTLDAKAHAMQSQFDAVADAVEMYRARNGSYPPYTYFANVDSTLGPYMHSSFFKSRLSIARGPYTQYSKPYWYPGFSGGLLYLPYIDPEVAARMDELYDDGDDRAGRIVFRDYRQYGSQYDYGLLYYYPNR